jgi:hypothetical protein
LLYGRVLHTRELQIHHPGLMLLGELENSCGAMRIRDAFWGVRRSKPQASLSAVLLISAVSPGSARRVDITDGKKLT